MTDHEFQPNSYSSTFMTQTPILRLESGDTVTTRLLDAHGYDSQGVRHVKFSNPLVGPFHVNSANPGDSLSVTLEEIRPEGEKGWSYIYPTAATVDASLYTEFPAGRRVVTWDIDLNAKMIKLSDPGEDLSDLCVPLEPMIGCLGVAPALSQAITSYSSGNFGGNLDCPLLATGSRIDFPVHVAGGLLYIGDCHAAQSHGEISGAAVEVPAVVRFRVDLRKNHEVSWPRGETDEVIFTISTGRPLDNALQRATAEMMRLLVSDYGMSMESAALRMDHGVRYLVSNAVNEQGTIACSLSKEFLPAKNNA